MESHSIIYALVIAVLVVLSAYFSATETAFTSINRIRIKNLASDGNYKAKLVMSLSENFDKLLSTILIGNNIVNITMTAVATVLFVDLYGEYGPTIATVVITIVVLIFGEISPKSLAKEAPESFAMFSAPILRILMIMFTPLNVLFMKWKEIITKLYDTREDRTITEEELLTMVEEAETEGGIDTERSELIQNAIEFNELEAWDVLTPRVDIASIEIDEEKDEITELFRETGYSRVPVYEDDMDNILGVLNQKDFHNYVVNTDKKIDDYISPVVFVAGSIKIAQLLKKMQSAKSHIAVVVDEYGGTEGIVTMEDIIEELVGEIWDEHDEVVEAGIVRQPNGTYLVQASTNIDKMFDFFDLEEDISPTTVNGWIVMELDKLPSVGDYFEYTDVSGTKKFKVTVTQADEKKALEVKLEVEDCGSDKSYTEQDKVKQNEKTKKE